MLQKSGRLFCRLLGTAVGIAIAVVLLSSGAVAQDGSTSLQGVVEDASSARIPAALVIVTNPTTGFQRALFTDSQGRYQFVMLAPGQYDVTAVALNMQKESEPGLQLHVGASTDLHFQLRPAGVTETVNVVAPAITVDGQTGEVSHQIVERSIQELPPKRQALYRSGAAGAGCDPGPARPDLGLHWRSIVRRSARLHQSNFLVDGADNNTSFFAQARGRYRAPYQFSNEVIKEFRVSSNSYSAELGRAGGAVFNVVTKSGSNDWHGNGFYYVRDRSFDARPAFADTNPDARQDQFGGTVSGPIKKNRAFFYTGFDENLMSVPSIVQFRQRSHHRHAAAAGLRLQRPGAGRLCRPKKLNNIARRVSHQNVGQCRVRKKSTSRRPQSN